MRVLMVLCAIVCSGCGFGEVRLVEERTAEAPAGAIDHLEIEVGAGDLVVTGDETLEAIEVEVSLRTNLVSELDDARAIDDLRIVLEPTEAGGALLRVELDERRGYWADVWVRVPARTSIALDDGSGDVSVSDVAELALDDESGDLEIIRVRGGTGVVDGSGDIVIEDVGSLAIRDASGDVLVTLVRGEAYLEDDSGSLRIEDVRGDLEIADGSGSIAVDRVAGTVTIHDGSGDIHVGEVGALDVRSDASGAVHHAGP